MVVQGTIAQTVFMEIMVAEKWWVKIMVDRKNVRQKEFVLTSPDIRLKQVIRAIFRAIIKS